MLSSPLPSTSHRVAQELRLAMSLVQTLAILSLVLQTSKLSRKSVSYSTIQMKA